MAACPPLTLTVPDGGKASGTIELTPVDASALHSLHLNVLRNWVDVSIGTTDQGGEITRSHFGATRFRLQPGEHVLSFTPNAASVWLTITRGFEGYAAVTDIRFLDAGDLVLSEPYLEEQIFSVRSEQSRSVRWLFNYNHATRALVRYANDSWGLIEWRTDDGPFLVGDATLTMTPDALRGTGVGIEASDAFFDPDHLGALIQLTHAGQHVTKTVTAEDQWTDPIRVTGVKDDRNFQTIVASSGTNTVTLQRSVGDDFDWADVGAYTDGTTTKADGFDNAVIYYRLGVKAGGYTSGSPVLALIYAAGETTGVARITEVTDDENVVVDVITPFASIAATRAWAEGQWSTLRGWPAAGGLFDGRLWMGAIINVWGTAADGFNSMLVGEFDGDAISRVLSVGDAAPIRWIKGALRLQIGADTDVADIDAVAIGEPGTLQIRSSALEEAITPSNVNVRQQNAKIVFVDASAERLRRISYDVQTGALLSEDLNRLHDEIGRLGGGFVGLTAQNRPRSRLWVPRADGQLGCLTLVEADDVVGWARQIFDGEVKAVTATPGVYVGDYDQDFVHMVIERELDGVPRRVHERIERERWVDGADAWHLESALKYEGAPARVLVGLDHLDGEDVLVWDGAEYGPFTVGVVNDAGEIGIDLGEDVTVTKAIIGKAMRSRFMSGKLPFGAQAGSSVGQPKKTDHVLLMFYQTALGGVTVGVGDGNDGLDAFESEFLTMKPLLDLAEDFTTDDPTALYTGEIMVTLDAGHLRDPRLLIEINGAGPAALLGFVVDQVTNESL